MSQRRPIVNERIMFITTNIRQREPLFAHDPYAREAIEVFYRVQELHPFSIYGFVIMPNHCHFLVHVPVPLSISKIMNRFKMGVSHSLGLGAIWQPRYYVTFPNSPWVALRYTHQNPVKAGIVESAEDYPWSSASGKWDVVDLPDTW